MGILKFSSVEAYIEHNAKWAAELNELLGIIHKTELEESIKWGMPAYTIDNKNVLGMAAFKEYVGLWFHQGVFLLDSANKLINAQEEKTKAMRQWRFESLEEIMHNTDLILSYLDEAIQNQKLGKEIKPERKKKALVIPPEITVRFKEDKAFAREFDLLSHSKKCEYAAYITQAKRSSTKQSRLDKIVPSVKEGIGLNDRYK